MIKICASRPGAVTLVVLSKCPEATSECLMSMFHEAVCPRTLSVIVIEFVKEYSEQSLSMLSYIEKAKARGSYLSSFSDLVKVYQILDDTKGTLNIQKIKERITSQELRPLLLLCSDATLFLPQWDSELLQNFQNLPPGSSMFCGSALSSTTHEYMSAFTYLDNLIEKTQGVSLYTANSKTHYVARVGLRPLHRKNTCTRIKWFALPILMETSIFITSEQDSFANLIQNCSMVYTSKTPVAMLDVLAEQRFFNNFLYETTQGIALQKYDLSKLSVLGLHDNTDYTEVIAKFGNLAALQWALQD